MQLYPLRFKPVFQPYIWGGRRLATELNKPVETETCAESWEIADHHQFQSTVLSGPLQGTPLNQLIVQYGQELLGQSTWQNVFAEHVPPSLRGRFPLLLKFLDAERNLSVQVHPDDSMAATLDPPDFGKTEAWYVMNAEPGARIYAGLRPGVTPEMFRQAITAGRTEDCLHSFEPQCGDCVFIQAGTLHAIGKGLLIAEIQQASNTTFRIFDWNRIGNDGQPRPLHIEQGILATDFKRGPVDPSPTVRDSKQNGETLVHCDKFVLLRHKDVPDDAKVWIGGNEGFQILAVISGKIQVPGDPHPGPLRRGDTILLPACLGPSQVNVIERAEFLQIYLPN